MNEVKGQLWNPRLVDDWDLGKRLEMLFWEDSRPSRSGRILVSWKFKKWVLHIGKG